MPRYCRLVEIFYFGFLVYIYRYDQNLQLFFKIADESAVKCLFQEHNKTCLGKGSERGRVVKNTVIAIDKVGIQNLLVPFCCVLGKDTLWYFTLRALGKRF